MGVGVGGGCGCDWLAGSESMVELDLHCLPITNECVEQTVSVCFGQKLCGSVVCVT